MGSLTFLRANPQLSTLRIWGSTDPTILDEDIVPLLAKSFTNLSSLSLVWKGVSISDDVLENIGAIQSLQQLHISAGEQFGWRHNWYANHEKIQFCLSKLRNLRTLALTRDGYPIVAAFVVEQPDNYFGEHEIEPRNDHEVAIEKHILSLPDSYFEDDDYDDDLRTWTLYRKRKEMIFTKIHIMRMAKEANEYAQVLPKLDWIYLGQIPFVIQDNGDGRQAVNLTEGLDECWTALRRMFGLPDSGS